MINLEIPKKFGGLIAQSQEIAREVFRPNSRRYDREEHTYPKELDMLRAVIEGAEEGGGIGGAGATGVRSSDGASAASEGNRNGSNMASCLAIAELCWGDVGLLLSMPGQGLGNSAIASVADEETLDRSKGRAAIKSFVVPRDNSGLKLTRVEDKLGIRASDTADFSLEECRIP